jgi:hypothetical protein
MSKPQLWFEKKRRKKMRESILKLMFVIVFLTFMSASAQAKAPVLIGWGGEEIIKIADFPNTEEFEYHNGEYFDAGYKYKQVTLFFIPVWNYDGKWVGYVEKEGRYLNLEKSELDELAAQANVKLPESPSLPFWHSIGGKIVFGFIVLVFIGLKMMAGSIRDEEETDVSEDSHSSSILKL